MRAVKSTRKHEVYGYGGGFWLSLLALELLRLDWLQYRAFAPGHEQSRVYAVLAGKLVPAIDGVGDTGWHQAISDSGCRYFSIR